MGDERGTCGDDFGPEWDPREIADRVVDDESSDREYRAYIADAKRADEYPEARRTPLLRPLGMDLAEAWDFDELGRY